jgi:hypothetical protein
MNNKDSDHHELCPARDSGIPYICWCSRLKYDDSFMWADIEEKSRREG